MPIVLMPRDGAVHVIVKLHTTPRHQAVARPPSVPKTRTCTEHHVCSVARQDAHREEVFKDLNFLLYESKELVNNQTILSMNQSS